MKYGVIGFVSGLVLGVASMILVPRFADPYLPQSLKPALSVEGRVVAKQREADRLLLTVRTKEGSTLVTFTKKIPEIDLLVENTDMVVLSMKQYRPFVENPEILRVAKEDGAEVPAVVVPLEPLGAVEDAKRGM